MSKPVPLHTLSQIFSGITLRSISNLKEADGIAVVQPKDIDQVTSRLIYNEVLRINDFDADEKHFLRAGDILISGKGKTTPVIRFEETTFKVVANAAFIVLRPDSKFVNADYIAWYLQLPFSQNYFDSNKAGSTVLNLSIKTVQNLEVLLPARAKQEAIGKLYHSLLKKNAKQLELMEKYMSLLNFSMYQEITNADV
jgi:restriction endonuclease S subunit